MKFLCPSCKAKYQIGDEKVAGRSVRMKCRKCGYVIQVSSVAGLGDALPGSEPPPGMDSAAPTSADAALEFMSEPPPAAVPVKSPAAPAVKSAPSASTSIAGAPGVRAPAASAPQRPEVKKPAAAPVARPSVPKPAAPVAKAPLPAPKAPPAAKPLAPKPAAAPARPGAAAPVAAAPTPSPAAPSAAQKTDKLPSQTGVGSAPVTDPLKNVLAAANKPAATIGALPEFEEEESTRIAPAGALAGAFSLAVGAVGDAGPREDSAVMPADEWFVGINGVPVGPIRLSELRSKAASGSINRESLVWRDGFEDWRPLRAFPELVAIIDEGLSAVRASLTPFTPPVGTAFGPAPSGDPIIVPGAAATAATGAAVEASSGVTGTAVVTDELEAAGVPRRSGTSPAAWIAVAIALLFGLTIGFVVFNKAGASKTIEVVKYVDRPVPSAAAAQQAPDVPAPSDDTTANGDAKNPTKRTGTGTSAGVKAPGTTASAEPDKPKAGGLAGLQGLNPNGPKGPDTAGPSGTPSGGGQLDSTQLSSTVARYKVSVQRACWQPALDTRDKDAPTTARVNVSIVILPSGSVQSATSGADPKGYRGLSQCISNRVRGWQFPPSGENTTVNVPFVFASQ